MKWKKASDMNKYSDQIDLAYTVDLLPACDLNQIN